MEGAGRASRARSPGKGEAFCPRVSLVAFYLRFTEETQGVSVKLLPLVSKQLLTPAIAGRSCVQIIQPTFTSLSLCKSPTFL